MPFDAVADIVFPDVEHPADASKGVGREERPGIPFQAVEMPVRPCLGRRIGFPGKGRQIRIFVWFLRQHGIADIHAVILRPGAQQSGRRRYPHRFRFLVARNMRHLRIKLKTGSETGLPILRQLLCVWCIAAVHRQRY